MISPYDFFTVKSKPAAEQQALVEGFAAQPVTPSKIKELRELAEAKFPLPSDANEEQLMRLWGLAFWMSDIGTVPSRDLRDVYLEDLDRALAHFGVDRRLIISMSGQADRAISILVD